MNLPDRVVPAPNLMTRRVGGETVILDLDSGTYFGLDPVASRIWDLINEGRKPEEVHEVMLGEYLVDARQLEADMLRLFADLQARALITTG
jgi:hypothetical protein